MAAGRAGAAPGLGKDDALQILALRTAECLDGGRAAILRPERRRRLLRIANLLGVGQFDANLVFAIVQDNARRGLPGAVAQSDPRLEVLGPRTRPGSASPGAARWIIPQILGALALGALMLMAMIRWLGG